MLGDEEGELRGISDPRNPDSPTRRAPTSSWGRGVVADYDSGTIVASDGLDGVTLVRLEE